MPDVVTLALANDYTENSLTGAGALKGEKGTDGTTYTPAIGTIETVDSALEATASVEVDPDTKQAKFNFAIPRGEAGADAPQIDDTTTSETSVWSSQKISNTYPVKAWNSLSSFLVAKGVPSSTIVAGNDNTQTVLDLMEPNETITDWLANTDGYNRFGIAVSKGTYINYLQFVKTSSGSGCVFATTDTGVVLTRRYSGGTLTGWVGQTTADVAPTSIASKFDATKITALGTSVSINSYSVKNGVCTVCLDITALVTTNELVVTGMAMPYPPISQYIPLVPYSNTSFVRNGLFLYGATGSCVLYNLTANTRYLCSFSYPVA